MFPSSEHACHESKTGVFLMLQLVVQTVRVYTVSGGHRRMLMYAPASVRDRSSSLHRGLFPLVARPGRRTLVPCLHIEHRCQANPLARAPLKRIAVRRRGRRLRCALSPGLRCVWPQKDTDKRRTSTAERRTGRAREASATGPASCARYVHGARWSLPPHRRALSGGGTD